MRIYENSPNSWFVLAIMLCILLFVAMFVYDSLWGYSKYKNEPQHIPISGDNVTFICKGATYITIDTKGRFIMRIEELENEQ